MNDPLVRAAAIGELVRAGGTAAEPMPLAEAVVSCCEELVRAGESVLAISLATDATEVVGAAGTQSALKLDLVVARASVVIGHYERCLSICRSWMARRDELALEPSVQWTELCIGEAFSLWHLNYAQEAFDKLSVIRTELLRQPDSALLAVCVVHLSSAEMRRGEFESARRYALEGV